MRAAMTAELLNTGRTRDIHFNQLLADHVQAHEPKAVLTQLRGYGFDHVSFTRREFTRLHLPASVNICTHVVFAGHAQDGAQRLSVQQENALIALPDGRLVLLNHRQALTLTGHYVDHGAHVTVSRGEHHDARATCTVQRLEYGRAAHLVDERDDLCGLGTHE